MVLDSIRTVVIWAVDLIVGWEKFQYLQIIGFVLLILGTMFYNEVIVIKWLGVPDRYMKQKELDEEKKKLLDDEPTVQ